MNIGGLIGGIGGNRAACAPSERVVGARGLPGDGHGKVAVEIVFTPVTYRIVAALKRAEHEDYYDRNTDFNPFTLKT